MAADSNQLDPNKLIFDISYEMSGTETVDFDARARKELRYWVEELHGPDFTSAHVVEQLNEWAESNIELPFGGHEFWDFDWQIRGVSNRNQENWIFDLIKDTPRRPPEVPGQSQFFEHSADLK